MITLEINVWGTTMKAVLRNIWTEEDGVLSFEWTLLLTLLVIGIVSGVTAVRDGIIDELGDVAQAMQSVDQSYTVSFPLDVDAHTPDTTSSPDSAFTDAITYTASAPNITLSGQNIA